jgi:hypothetical protein
MALRGPPRAQRRRRTEDIEAAVWFMRCVRGSCALLRCAELCCCSFTHTRNAVCYCHVSAGRRRRSAAQLRRQLRRGGLGALALHARRQARRHAVLVAADERAQVAARADEHRRHARHARAEVGALARRIRADLRTERRSGRRAAIRAQRCQGEWCASRDALCAAVMQRCKCSVCVRAPWTEWRRTAPPRRRCTPWRRRLTCRTPAARGACVGAADERGMRQFCGGRDACCAAALRARAALLRAVCRRRDARCRRAPALGR